MKCFYAVIIVIISLFGVLQSQAQVRLTAYTEMDPKTQTASPLFTGTIKLLKASGYSYSIDSAPWVRTYKQVLANNNGLVFPIYRTPQRETLFHWFCPIAPARDIYLFKLTSRRQLHVSNISQAKNYSLGVVRTTMVHQFLSDNGFKESDQLDITAYDKTNLTKLLNNRIDFIAQSQERMLELLEQLNLPPSILTKEYLLFDRFKYPLCTAANKKMAPEIIENLKLAYAKVINIEDLEQPRILKQIPEHSH